MYVHYKVLNKLIKKRGYFTGLDVGAEKENVSVLSCKNWFGVNLRNQGTEDIKISSLKVYLEESDILFDLIFLNDDHSYPQCYLDIVLALENLDEGGVVAVLNSNPASEYMQTDERHPGGWNGPVWRSILLARGCPDLEVCTVDIQHGLTFIAKGTQKYLKFDEDIRKFSYNDLDDNREEWLKLVDLEVFETKYLGAKGDKKKSKKIKK